MDWREGRKLMEENLAKTVPPSEFLRARKPWMRLLADRLGKEFDYASILGADVEGKTYSVSSKVTSVSDGRWGERGFVARVYGKGRYFESAFNEMPESEAEVLALAQRIAAAARSAESGAPECPPPPEEEALEKTFSESAGILPGDMGPDEILAALSGLAQKMLAHSPEIVDARASIGSAKVSKIFISAKKDLEQNYFWSEAYTFATARRQDNTRLFFKSYSGMKGLELLDEMKGGAAETAACAVELLDARPVEPGEYDVICSPDSAGLIAHEAFGHGVELDMFARDRAKAREYMGREVASSAVSMRDGAASARQVASFLFDDEGNIAKDTAIIEKGILRSAISDAISAARMGLAPTGNGRRHSYANKAYSRMTNTFFTPGPDKLDDMIVSVKRGYLIEKAYSGMEDPKDWGIQCMFTHAREILDGKLSGRIVAPVMMTGYVPDLLKAISMVSEETTLHGSGACGKGYKELVKTSSGGPYIKTKARLG